MEFGIAYNEVAQLSKSKFTYAFSEVDCYVAW